MIMLVRDDHFVHDDTVIDPMEHSANIVKVPNTIPQAHANRMNRIGHFTNMVKLQRCFEMVCMPKIPATLTNIACITVLLLQASGKTDMTSRLLSPLADDFLL